MRASSYILIPATQQGTESENYDGISTGFTGVPVKAAGYYSKYKDLQTLSWHLNAFDGDIIIEATLDDNPESENYFTIAPITENEVSPITVNETLNVEGKYTWIRARVINFTDGSITKVTLGY